ncbi:MAG TPA: cupin domain-containing protein [Candidatus Udaeobacter sp.]|nr:cupin domain-containing protein [Candidatus Udaeobacter sp.]
MRYVLIFLAGSVFISLVYLLYIKIPVKPLSIISKEKLPSSFYTNIIKATQENKNFRRVLFTGKNSQLVVMSIPPGGEIGEEIHKYTEQTLFFLSGKGEGMLNDKKFPINPGDVVVVVPGTKHNFWNTGAEDLKVYTVYSPPNHIDGRVHATKADADADLADEAIGETAPKK